MASRTARLLADDDDATVADGWRSVLDSLPELYPHDFTSFDRDSLPHMKYFITVWLMVYSSLV